MPSEQCAICLCALGDEVSIPCSNNHKFHSSCLREWATTLHNCPICREDIKTIRVLLNGVEKKTMKPPELNMEKREGLDAVVMDAPYDTMHCELCQQATDEAQMLLCDTCDLGFHMYCLQPPLRTVPAGLWECDACRRTNMPSISRRARNLSSQRVDDESGDEGEIIDSSGDEDKVSGGNADQFDTEDEHILRENPNIPSTSHQPTVTMKDMKKKKRKSTKHKKKKNSRKAKKLKSKEAQRSSSTKTKSKHKQRKKDKRRASRHRDRDDGDGIHRRIANICGLDLKHSDRYKVVQHSKSGRSDRTEAMGRLSGTHRLDLLGNEWIPPPMDESSDNDNKRKRNSPPASCSHTYTGSTSLFDEIMANQKKILAPGNLLKINRDGTLNETEELQHYLERKNKATEGKRDDKRSAAAVKVKNISSPKPAVAESSSSVSITSKSQSSPAPKHNPEIFARSSEPLCEGTSKTPAAAVNQCIDPKSNKPMLIVKPDKHDDVKKLTEGGEFGSALALPGVPTSSSSNPTSYFSTTRPTYSNAEETSSSSAAGHASSSSKRNRRSRWQPVDSHGASAASTVSSTTDTILNNHLHNHLPPLCTSDSNNSLSNNFQISSVNNLKGVDFTQSTLNSNALAPIFPGHRVGNSLDLFSSQPQQQQQLPANSIIPTSIQPTNFNTTNGQIQNPFFGRLSTEKNMANILQQLLTGPPLSQNLVPSSSIPSSSSNVISMPSNMSTLANLNLPKNALPNSLNLFFNSAPAQLTDLLNTSSSASNTSNILSATSNLSNIVRQLPNHINVKLPMNPALLPHLNQHALPHLDGNLALMTHFLNQQQNAQQIQAPAKSSQDEMDFLMNMNKSLLDANQMLLKPPFSLLNNFPNPTMPPTNADAKPANEIIPPPPPDTSQHFSQLQTSGVRCGLDSPMDIEDDDNEPSSSFNTYTKSSDKKHISPSSTTTMRKDRSETIKIADAAMKSALKPYFTKRMVSKDEYKEIMKKGVAKLRDKDQLKPEKVEKFVKQYVDLIAKRRQK